MARVKLTPTPLAMQSSAYLLESYTGKQWGAIDAVGVRAWLAQERLAVQIEWAAPKPVSSFAAPDAFQDRVALFFPSAEDTPLITMGAPESPGEVWTWRGDGTVERLEARGPGSIKRHTDVGVRGEGAWQEGHWQVVLFGRAPAGPRRFGLAAWRGSTSERGGLKAFSPDWVVLDVPA